MNIDLARKLMQFQKENYTIEVSTYGTAHHIYEKDGDIVFDSDIHTGASLSKIDPTSVAVSKPVAGWYA